METVYEYLTGDKQACISTDEPKVIRHVMDMLNNYPDEVVLAKHPTNNNGVLVAYVPKTWIKLPKPPKKMELSDEERKSRSERIKNAKKLRSKDATSDTRSADE